MKIKTSIRNLLKQKLNFSIIKDDNMFDIQFDDTNILSIYFIPNPSHKNESILDRKNIIPEEFSTSISEYSYDRFLKIFNIDDEYEFIIISPEIGDIINNDVINKNNVKLFSRNDICIYKGEILGEKELLEKSETLNISEILWSDVASRNRMLIKLVEKDKIKDEKLIDFINLINN